MDPSTQERLREIVRRESRSMLQYAREVPLWAGPNERPTLDRVHEIAQAERATTDALATWLQRQRVGIQHLGPYAANFLSLNDARLAALLPRIAEDHAGLLRQLESDAAALAPAMNGHTHL